MIPFVAVATPVLDAADDRGPDASESSPREHNADEHNADEHNAYEHDNGPGLFADGTERVIVELDVDITPEDELDTVIEVIQQRHDIALATDELNDQLDTTLDENEVDHVGTLQTLPIASYEVTPEGLAAISELPGVRSVSVEVPVPPLGLEPSEIVEAHTAHSSSPPRRGAGQAIAILDTGVDPNHPFLAGPNGPRVVSEACYSSNIKSLGSTSLCPGGARESTAPGSGRDCHTSISGCGHGTHVAGIAVGAESVVDGRPIRGVAPAADIISIQVFSRFTSTNSILSYPFDQLRGLERVKQLSSYYDIAAVNMSLGGGTYESACNGTVSQAYRTLIGELFDAGIPVVIAAGNNGSSNGISSPACVTGAVAVGATTNDGRLAAFANTHRDLIHLYAPGQATTSSTISDAGGARSYGYATWSGSSTAAPLVAGAFALLAEHDPSGSSAAHLSRLRSTGVPVSRRAGGSDVGFSHREIRIAAAIASGSVGATSPGNGTGSGSGGVASGQMPLRLVDTRSMTRDSTVADTRIGRVGEFGSPVRIDIGLIPGIAIAETAAVVLNLTATDALDAGFLTAAACESQPTVSSVNFTAGGGKAVANTVIVPVGASGEICIWSHGRTHLIVDVFGAVAEINSITPTRAADTRGAHRIGEVGRLGAPLRIAAASIPGVPASGASGLVLNVTAVDPLEAGYLTAGTCESVPGTSNLNFAMNHQGTTAVANTVVVPVGASGEICIWSHGRTHVIVDVFGHLDPTSEIGTIPAVRISDTRNSHRIGEVGRLGAPLRIAAASIPGVPATGVRALVLNVTAVDALEAGYLTASACEALPDVSNANFTQGSAVANTVVVPVGASGEICIWSHGRSHLVVDALGYLHD